MTLGKLEKVAGVHTSFHAKVASTPVIRGLSGPRVLIAQNGLDVSDVSRVGPDHSVASEASTAQQIEVLRGPATLFYGALIVGVKQGSDRVILAIPHRLRACCSAVFHALT